MEFDWHAYADEHNLFMRDMRMAGMPGSTGGMTNFPGLFIYAVARETKAFKILEVGTRNGVSAATFCRAMNRTNGDGVLISVDVVDVEKGKARPGDPNKPFPKVPSEMIAAVGDANIQKHFIVGRGADVLRQVPAKSLHLVLLDGSHTEGDVYEEIPLALKAIRNGGVLLFDDVYPNGAPLKSHSKVIRGPWLAIKKHMDEGLIERYHRPQDSYSVAYVLKEETSCSP